MLVQASPRMFTATNRAVNAAVSFVNQEDEVREGGGSAGSAAAGQDSGKDSGGGEGANGKGLVDMVSCIVNFVLFTLSRCRIVLVLHFQPFIYRARLFSGLIATVPLHFFIAPACGRRCARIVFGRLLSTFSNRRNLFPLLSDGRRPSMCAGRSSARKCPIAAWKRL